MKTNLERIELLSALTYSLCKKFKMNPYAITFYPNHNQIYIQGNYLPEIEEKLIEDGYKLDKQFVSEDGSLFRDFKKHIDNVEISFTLEKEKTE